MTVNEIESSAEPAIAPAKIALHTSDHLANERTFLAWIRTSISLIGLGFVVAKFSVWLRELASRIEGSGRIAHTRLSLPLGIGMMAAGGLLAILASCRYQRVRYAIDHGIRAAASRTVTLVTVILVVITAALILYMLQTR